MSKPAANGRIRWSLGPVLVLVGSSTLWLAYRIPPGSLGNNEDPGPRAFPIALAALLIIGGLGELVLNLIRSTGQAVPRSAPGDFQGLWETLGRRESINVVILIFALAFYLAAMPWVGFLLATLLFSVGMMLLLGAHWRLAVPFSIGLVAVIYLLFTVLFRVQLPSGVLGASW